MAIKNLPPTRGLSFGGKVAVQTSISSTQVTLVPLSLDTNNFTIGATQGTVIGTVQGLTSGSTLLLTDPHSGAVQLVSGVIQVAATPPAGAVAFNIQLTEVLDGAINSPNITVLSIIELASFPFNMFVPFITGTAQIAQTLTASPGSWTNNPTSFTYQWNRAGAPIAGATASTYIPVLADIGSTLTVSVIASNSVGSSTPSTSAATSGVSAVETNIEFRGRFSQRIYARFIFSQPWIDGIQPPPVVETLPGFIGRFWQTAPYSRLKFKFNSSSIEGLSQLPTPETQPHFMGRFGKQPYVRFAFNAPLVEGLSPPPIIETQPNFIGRFGQAVYVRPKFNVPSIEGVPAIIQPETNIEFRGRFTAIVYARFLYNSYNTWDQPPPPAAETQPHFIGKFWQTAYSRLKFNSPSIEGAAAVIQFETNIEFHGRFASTIYARLRFNNSSHDMPILATQPEAQPHFTGRFTAQGYSRFRVDARTIIPAGNVPVDVSLPTIN